jgi:hypothetical protein
MSRLQAVGVMLVALGLIYAVLYAGWVRKRRQHASAAIAAERRRTDGGTPEAPSLHDERVARVVVEGTYVSTTTADNRFERVVTEGLGNRARATLTVQRGSADQLVRIERQGESTVIIPASRLVSVRRDRGMVGKVVGANRMLVIRWTTPEGDLYDTGFLPRYRADVDKVESALWWHSTEPRQSEPRQSEPDQPNPPATEGHPTP